MGFQIEKYSVDQLSYLQTILLQISSINTNYHEL